MTGPGRAGRRRCTTGRALAAGRRALASERGTALIIAVMMLAIMGLFLVGFQAMNNSELQFGGYSRNSTLAFDFGEAGVQEGMKRLNLFGAIPGATCFVNSMVPTATCSGGTAFNPNAGTVVYQAPLAANGLIFPILSLASYGGATRAVRVFVQAIQKAGFANAILGPQVTFAGDASPITGAVYAQTSVSFADYRKAPECASGATPTNLIGPQVMAGTTLIDGSGPNQTPPCGTPVNAVGTFTSECTGTDANAEVAPTPCPQGRSTDGGGNVLPYNWHPATPIGMNKTDFTAIVTASTLPPGLSVVTATQNDVAVTDTSNGTYTPSYWSGSSGPVKLIVATAPFCVNPSTRQIQMVTPVTGTCGAGWTYYGNQVGGVPYTTRYLDWGLVSDDLSRTSAQTFFQPPTCAACINGNPNGRQNGIRYVPILPLLWGSSPLPTFAQYACTQHEPPPGANVFDQLNVLDGISCASPPTTTITTTSAIFSGTKSAPESLVIDNAGIGVVQVTGSIAGNNTLTCSNTNFDNYNWGVIVATGDIDLQANFVFTGYIYTPGNVTSHGNVLIQGGVFSANSGSSSASVNQVDSLGTVNFCSGSSTQFFSPQFYTFSAVSWQDRPASSP